MKNVESLFKIEQMAETRWFYTLEEKNKKGESLVIELTKVECDINSKNSLPSLWKQHGFMDRVLETYWHIQTYVRDEKGNCRGAYNPTIKDGKINFDYKFEATEGSKELLLNETYKRFIEVV